MAGLNIVLTVIACLFGLRIAYELTINRKNVPNWQTTPQARRVIIAQLKKDFALRPGQPYRIIDLGSGNGQLTWHIARAIPGAEVIGLDLSLTGYTISKTRQWLLGPKNLAYKQQDFLAYDVSGADAIVTYLGYRMMNRLRDKLSRELKPGAIVVSNNFPLGGDWQPVDATKLGWIFKSVILTYRQSS